MNQEVFAHNLRLLRMSARITAQELSNNLNLSLHRISALEGNAKVHVKEEEIEAIAAYFEVPVETITTIRAKIVFE